jgi:carbonic anhydrase
VDVVDRLVQRATRHPAGLPSLDAMPLLGLALVTCMDARIDPVTLFGLRPGGAHVIRNAGGVPTPDVLESLRLSQERLGTQRVVVLHHTRCSGLEARLPGRSVDETVLAALRALRAADLPYPDAMRGFVLDIKDGCLREVTEAQGPMPPAPARPPDDAPEARSPEPPDAPLAAASTHRRCRECGRSFDPSRSWRRAQSAYCGDLCRRSATRRG